MLPRSSLSSLSILTNNVLNTASNRFLISISFSFFSWSFDLFFSFGPCCLVSSFWQPPCVCFYVLGGAAMSPGLCRVALCSRCLTGLSGAVYLVNWSRCSRCVPYVSCVCPPVEVEPWFLLAHQCDELPLRPIDCEKWPWLQWWRCCTGADL